MSNPSLSRNAPLCITLVFIHLVPALYKFRNLKHRQTEIFFFTFHMDTDRIQ